MNVDVAFNIADLRIYVRNSSLNGRQQVWLRDGSDTLYCWASADELRQFADDLRHAADRVDELSVAESEAAA